MKRGTQEREKKILSANGLLKLVRKIFEKVASKRLNKQGKNRKISPKDSLMSAHATEGHLVVFDPSKKSWDEKIYREQRQEAGKTIEVWGC
jgi:hypothetical protein